jgi:pseudouridine-5'-phosphate glycosidase
VTDWLINRAGARAVALETTLLCHGVSREEAKSLALRLDATVRASGAAPCLVGVLHGRAIVGMTGEELGELIASEPAKLNSSNLGLALDGGVGCGATSVSATVEIAGAAGVRVFATGGLGGVHKGSLDVSADLVSLTRHPVAVVCSGVKSILDVVATRELLETLGVPVVGFGCDELSSFYTRESGCSVDARFDEVAALSAFVGRELARSGRAVVISNPIHESAALDRSQLAAWISTAEGEADARSIRGRLRTPYVLGRLHELSKGVTLRANVALVLSNAELAGQLAVQLDQ